MLVYDGARCFILFRKIQVCAALEHITNVGLINWHGGTIEEVALLQMHSNNPAHRLYIRREDAGAFNEIFPRCVQYNRAIKFIRLSVQTHNRNITWFLNLPKGTFGDNHRRIANLVRDQPFPCQFLHDEIRRDILAQ